MGATKVILKDPTLPTLGHYWLLPVPEQNLENLVRDCVRSLNKYCPQRMSFLHRDRGSATVNERSKHAQVYITPNFRGGDDK